MSTPEVNIVFIVIALTTTFLLLIAGIAIIIVIANRQRVKREADFEKELRTVEQEVQEELLTNVSQELHDNIGQMLTVMHLQIKKGQIKQPETAATLQPVSDTLNDTIDQVKSLARGLNSEMVQGNGLKNNIEMEVSRLRKLEKFSISLEHDDTEINLTPDKQLLIFRTYQEIMNNIMKHALASEVNITLQGTPFMLEVKDNGRGFDLDEKKLAGGGMGLSNVIKRSKLAGLTCQIFTSEGKGCIFMLGEP